VQITERSLIADRATTVVVTPTQPDVRREFVCGMVIRGDETPTTEKSTETAGDAIWDAIVAGAAGKHACVKVRDLLALDKECTGEQCRAPTVVAEELLARCARVDAIDVNDVDAWRGRWEAQAPPNSKWRCVKLLERAARGSTTMRTTYRKECLVDRTASQVEEAVLSRPPE
jgi:hypothetical protein